LLSYFHSQQIAHGEHSHPTLTVDYRQMTRADHFHSFKRLMGSFVALNNGPEVTGDLAYPNVVRVSPGHNDTFQQVTFGKDTQ
jgi:hypothetical protein